MSYSVPLSEFTFLSLKTEGERTGIIKRASALQRLKAEHREYSQ